MIAVDGEGLLHDGIIAALAGDRVGNLPYIPVKIAIGHDRDAEPVLAPIEARPRFAFGTPRPAPFAAVTPVRATEVRRKAKAVVQGKQCRRLLAQESTIKAGYNVRDNL